MDKLVIEGGQRLAGDVRVSSCASVSGMPRSAWSTAKKLSVFSAKHAVAATVTA